MFDRLILEVGLLAGLILLAVFAAGVATGRLTRR